jgi:hypothetical protein
MLLLGSLKHLPQIIRVWLCQAAEVAEAELPSPTGRPPVDSKARVEIVAYVGQLHTRGTSLEISKRRAAQRFGQSESTVQRIWDDRGNLEEADLRSVLRWLSDLQPTEKQCGLKSSIPS